MGVPSQPLPTIGQPNSTEDAKVRSALSELQSILTANVDAANLAAKAVTSPKWNPFVQVGANTTNISSANATFNTDVLTFTIAPTFNTRQLVLVTATAFIVAGQNEAVSANVGLKVDGVLQPFTSQMYVQPVTFGSQSANAQASMSTSCNAFGLWLPTLSAGTHTLTVNVEGSSIGNTAGSLPCQFTMGTDSVAMIRVEMAN
jgi:hypothetical protein